MGMKLENVDLLQLLPVFMRDDEANIALAQALSELIRGPGGEVRRLREWDQIDNLSSEELDEMAWEMSLEWYDPTVSLESKRATLKSAIALKEKAGTKWAVIEAIRAAYGTEPEISEWFEYNGDPDHFRVRLTASGSFDFPRILRAINYVKRARAKLDDVEMVTTEQAPIYIGAAMVVTKAYTAPPMDPDDARLISWLTDELGNTLEDELGNILIDD